MIMKDCSYPNCLECTFNDCVMENKDIRSLLKRRRWAIDPEKYRQKQRDYKNRIKSNLPHCDECENCILVKKDKQDGYRRLCISKMRLIEQKVSNCPQWCEKRTTSEDYLKRRHRILEQKKEKYQRGKEVKA